MQRGDSSVQWSAEAVARLKRVPFFVRPFVKRRAETYALEQGASEVTAALLDELKQKEHQG